MSCIPPWVPLVDSSLRKANMLPTFTFCTVSKDKVPHARTCVSRGWLFDSKSTGVMVFTTDKRMQKATDLTSSDAFESVFYLPNSRTQFRFSGFAQFLTTSQIPSLQSKLAMPKPIESPHLSLSPESPDSDIILAPRGPDSSSSQALPPSYFPVITPAYDPTVDYDTVFPPPTAEEWRAEYERIWSVMSPKMKASFKYPTPKSLMDDATRKAIDSITRGVDGSSDDAGKENFIVVLMLVNSVDILDEDKGRRTVFTRVRYDEWKEQEVSP